MAEEIELIIREAIPEDALKLQQVTQQMSQESDYLIIDHASSVLSVTQLEAHLDRLYDSPRDILLLALVDQKIVGIASLKGETEASLEHIGEIAISLLQSYWGIGLGSTLLADLIDWAQTSELIKRLELRVEERNHRAIKLYQRLGFVKEGVLKKAIKDNQQGYHDVLLMARLINE